MMDIDIPAPRLNPWTSMWIKPRMTIQQVIETDPTRWVLLLVALDGMFQILDRAFERDAGQFLDWSNILVLAAIVGPLAGVIGLYISSWLIQITGKWIGGKASGVQLRAAIAWAKIPTVWALALWVPMMLAFGQDLFVAPGHRQGHDPNLAYNIWGFATILFFAEITSFILMCQTIGQVQGFSGWKAFGNILLGVLLLAIPLVIFILAGVMLVVSFGVLSR